MDDILYLQKTLGQVQDGLNLMEQIVSPFSESKTYLEQEVVSRQEKIYICTSPISQPGPWNSSQWMETTIQGIFDLKQEKLASDSISGGNLVKILGFSETDKLIDGTLNDGQMPLFCHCITISISVSNTTYIGYVPIVTTSAVPLYMTITGSDQRRIFAPFLDNINNLNVFMQNITSTGTPPFTTNTIKTGFLSYCYQNPENSHFIKEQNFQIFFSNGLNSSNVSKYSFTRILIEDYQILCLCVPRTKWQFNSSITLPETESSGGVFQGEFQDVFCYSNGTMYKDILWTATTLAYGDRRDPSNATIVYSNGVWQNETYKRIQINNTATFNNNKLIFWLRQNAEFIAGV